MVVLVVGWPVCVVCCWVCVGRAAFVCLVGWSVGRLVGVGVGGLWSVVVCRWLLWLVVDGCVWLLWLVWPSLAVVGRRCWLSLIVAARRWLSIIAQLFVMYWLLVAICVLVVVYC